MWNYEKRLEYPVNISTPNPKIAQVIISQFGGPDGELSASMRYLSQRYTMPYRNVAGLLTDIGTEAPEMFRSGAKEIPMPWLAAPVMAWGFPNAFVMRLQPCSSI